MITGNPRAQVTPLSKTDSNIENVSQPSTVSHPSTSHVTTIDSSSTTHDEEIVQGECAVAVENNTAFESTIHLCPGSSLPVSTTRSSNRPSHITFEQEFVPASYSLVQEDASDTDDPCSNGN